MSFDFSTLITNRSASDLENLRALLSTPVSDWTAEQLAQFNQAISKGAYNYTDLNRVTQCMEYLDETLRSYGYETGYQPLIVQAGREDPYIWLETDSPTQSQMAQYLNNVLSIWSTIMGDPTLPETMVNLTQEGANQIEAALIEINTAIEQIIAAMARSNSFTFWSGNRPFPTAYSNRGRTWAELDAMNTTWRNWQVASWYLLLYGNLEAEGDVT